MGHNQVILRHQKFTFPRVREWAKWASEWTSERSGGRERSEQSGASEWVSGASKRVKGRASGPVLTSRFMAVLNHSALALDLDLELSLTLDLVHSLIFFVTTEVNECIFHLCPYGVEITVCTLQSAHYWRIQASGGERVGVCSYSKVFLTLISP